MDITLFLDHQCNLRCSYCYNGEKFSRPMSLDIVRKALDLGFADKARCVDVGFFGGEPLLHKNLLRDTIRYAKDRAASLAHKPSLRFTVNTNGTLVDDEVIALFTSVRDVEFFVSLDGPKEVHDACRRTASGCGSFEEVITGLARLRSAGIRFHVAMVFGVHNAGRLGEAVRTAVATGARRISLQPNLRDDWTDESLAALRTGLRDAADAWMEMFRAGTVVRLEPFHNKILTYLQGGVPCPGRCRLVATEVTVTPTGNIYPCSQMVGQDSGQGYVIGHVDTGIDQSALAQLRELKDRVESTCEPCALRDRCESHCACRQVSLTGRIGEITATLCEIEAACIEAADRVAEHLHAEGCRAFEHYFYERKWKLAPGAVLPGSRTFRSSGRA
jgi:uncharacterized protein